MLLKCFKLGCDPEQICSAIGLELGDLFPDRREAGGGAGPLKRRRMLAAVQALALLEFEALLVLVAARNLAGGHALTPVDLERLGVAAQRIQELAEETRA